MSEPKRMRTFAAVSAAVAWLAAAAPAARAAEPAAGVIVSVQGHPRLQAAGKTEETRAKVNDLVREGDTLKTGKGERVGVAFVGGAELRVNEESAFTVRSGGGVDKPTSVFATLGDAWTRLISGHAGPGIEVRGPAAVAAVRGTEADVEIGDRMTVKVYEGHVDVENDKGKTTLLAGQQSSVAAAGSAPAPASKMSPKDYRTWQNGVPPKDLDKSLRVLRDASEEFRRLELRMKGKDGEQKKVKLDLKKK